ncbi:DUF2939 domain-containing protein [Brevundimonas sp. NIBR11]|uniref:DUF2939 domain-containing protein n=1 Tax=Brevundimonas sp. NIBR11 TaxID=3015999 RepID=UPI0022F12812|nr:DUF2939 domain-containing protein [Brevundimonas sp. NIBR11]WGM30201.1 hypothetical protein KKHFBJBL_00417 [Brevundimonas sp. NIBR11]
MKGLIKGVVILGVVAFLIAYFGTPILTVNNLVAAAKAGDEAGLERMVDFPAFRDSVKDELTARLMAEANADPDVRSSGLGGLGMMLAPMLVSGAVDALVTAPTIAAMVRTADTPDPEDVATARTPEPESEDKDIRQSYGYRDLNTFVLGLTDPDRPDETLKLLLKRQGVFGWKLSGIDLPEKAA